METGGIFPRRIISQEFGCRDKGEILAIYSNFVFGNNRKVNRLWTVSKERIAADPDTMKRFVGDIIPYEQDISTFLGDAKQLASKHGTSFLIGDSDFIYVILAPGYFSYRIVARTGEVKESGGNEPLMIRYSLANLPERLFVIISTERVGSDLVRTAVKTGGSGEPRGKDRMISALSVGGPLGVFSVSLEKGLTGRDNPITSAYVSSDQGQIRQTNEDCGSVVGATIANESGVSRYTLCGVADGVGGLAGGEIASRIAISGAIAQTIRELFTNGISDPSTVFSSAFDMADEKIAKVGAYINKTPASTLSLAILKSPGIYTGSAGDSRIYHVKRRKGLISQLTMDHRLTAEGHQSHVITRSLGSRDHTPDVSYSDDLESGDLVLACSDGLHDLIDEDEIMSAALAGQTPKEVCSRLIRQANSRGGRDNITVATVAWRGNTRV